MGTKYVINTHPNNAAVKVYYDDPNGETMFGKPKRLHIDFRPESTDRINGVVTHSGVVPVSDAVLEELNKDKSFLYALKAGWLSIADTMPEAIMTPTDALIAERQKVSDLSSKLNAANAEIASLKEKLADLGKTDLDR